MRKGIVGTGDGDSEKCLRGRVEEVNSMAEGKGSELTPSSGLGNTQVREVSVGIRTQVL